MSLLGETAPEGTDTLCAAFMFYKQQLSNPLTVSFHFVVVKDREFNLLEVNQKYERWTQDRTTLKFTLNDDPSPVIELDLQEQEVGSWKILPLSSPSQISKTAVTNHQIGSMIPHCGCELQLLPEKSLQQLHYKVHLIGVSSLADFHIRYPLHEAPSVAVPQTSTVSQDIYSQAPTIAKLMTHVAHKTPTKWYEVGIVLDIEASVLNRFEAQTSDPVRLFLMVFDHWEKEQKVPYTWYTIIVVLEEVQEIKAAGDIREWLSGSTLVLNSGMSDEGQETNSLSHLYHSTPLSSSTLEVPGISGGDIYSQAPTIAKLMTHVAHKTPTKWYEVGIVLDIEVSVLNGFEAQTNDQVRLFVMVFDHWEKVQKVPYTWYTIIGVLEEVQEIKVAGDIREWLSGFTLVLNSGMSEERQETNSLSHLENYSTSFRPTDREQQPEGWNQPCLEEHLAEIATSITEWREISPFLGLSEAEEHEILGSGIHSVRLQKIAMLRLWKKKKGTAATYNQLCRAFRKSKLLDLEDKMKAILAESNASTNFDSKVDHLITDFHEGVPTSHAEQTVPLPNVEAWCTAFMFYKQQTYSSLVADFHFVVVKNAESYLQEVKTAYQGWSVDTLKIYFESDAIELDLQDQEVGSWKISPSAIPQITKAAVSNFQIGKWIPHCSFKLQLLSEKIPQPLVHKVALTGASPSFFYIKYDPVNPNDAMKSLQKIVTMSITNIGTQGYPGIGKTSVLDLAMGKEPAPTRTSTDCVDPPSRYLMIDSADSEEVEWEKVTTDKMSQMVREAVKKIIEENSSGKTQAHKPATAESNQTELESHSRDTAESLKPPVDDSQTRPLVDIFPPVFSTSHPDRHPVLSSSNDTWLSDCLKALYSSKRSGVIFNAHWMMVTDSGGQPPFLDAAALFLQNSCLQIFPVKLNEPLSKRPEFSYFFDGVRASFDKSSLQFTHKQIIETLAKSVASIQPPYTPSATKCPKGAKFTIVGTFKDESHKCSETIEEKNLILQQVLEPYRPFQVPYGTKAILPINAVTTNKKERERSARKLRRLFKAADVTMEVDVKLRWFGFLLSVLTIAEKEHKVVLTLDECYELGESLCMDKSETHNAIQFFHDISLIMHFDDPKLRDSVIINTKPVLTKLSKIITVSFLNEDFLADNYDIFPPPGAKELLQQHGRFSRDTLEKCGIKFTKPITLQFFLDILEHVKIVVAIDKESEYFMPCALSSLPEANVSHSSPPWVIRLRVRRGFEDVYIPIPVGYLPAVVVFLLTEFASHFSTDRRQRQYRNKISLRYKRGGTVHLIERHLRLEIYLSCFEDLPQDCTTIRDQVLESIRLAEKKLHIIEGAITKVDSFLCSCDKGNSHHACTYNPLSRFVECEETEELFKLKHHHQLWLGLCTSPILWNQPISIESHLARIAIPINDWRAIAPFLGLTAADESAILGEATNSFFTQKVAMLRRWQQIQGEKATYEQLCRVFKECGRIDLVEEVQQLVTDSSEETPLWNQPFSEIHLAKLAAHIDDWRAISPLLGLTAADDSAILGEAPHSVPTQRAAMLRRWKQIQGKKATYGRLYQVFEQCKRADLVEKVKQLVADLPKESSAEPGTSSTRPPTITTAIATHESMTQEQAATEMSLEESPEMSELMTAPENN